MTRGRSEGYIPRESYKSSQYYAEKHTKAELEKVDLLMQLKNAELKHENQMKNAMIELKDAELKHEKEISAYKLELEKSKNMMERAVWEATQNPK